MAASSNGRSMAQDSLGAIDDALAGQIAAAAQEMAGGAGEILLGHFGRKIDVEYKDEAQKDPVTSADKASQEYLSSEIAKKFPDHGILGEEGADDAEADTPAPDFVWALDPLDGTTNFLNGLPIYAVSIGVLHKGVPVASSIFVPWPNAAGGVVLHARRGGGCRIDGEPLTINSREGPNPNRLSGLPGSFGQGFRFSGGLHRRAGEPRVTGSIAYELALAAMGSVQYALFGGPKLWDVAAGMLIVPEAGGRAMVRPKGSRTWEDPIVLVKGWEDGSAPTFKELRKWGLPVLAGDSLVVPSVAANLRARRPSVRRRLAMLARKLRTSRKSKES